MKKMVAIIAIMACIFVSFLIGRNFGINHVIEDAIVSYHEGIVLIELDGQLYEHYAE